MCVCLCIVDDNYELLDFRSFCVHVHMNRCVYEDQKNNIERV